ncbi:MAG: hypothetical protein WKG01_06395 [Kofleriaceae bacterium]
MKPIPALLLLLAACGEVDSALPDAPIAPDDGAPGDDGAVTDAPAGRCDPSKPFGAPTLVANLNTTADEMRFTITLDELTGFVSDVDLSVPAATILTTQRRSPTARFSNPSGLDTTVLNKATGNEGGPSPLASGSQFYFHRQAGPNVAVYLATRGFNDEFSAGTQVTVDGGPLLDALSSTISADGMTLYWLDATGFKLHSATRGATATAFTGGTAASTMALGFAAVLSADELTLYYANSNGEDVLAATRASKSEMFATGSPVPGVNSPQNDHPTHVTPDGCVLYLVSNRPGGVGGRDIWEARRPL